MGNKPKQSAGEAFDLNIEDAKILVEFARLLSNQRKRRMRVELRERIGSALGVPPRRWGDLDCLQNDGAFMISCPDTPAGANGSMKPVSGHCSARYLWAACNNYPACN